MELYITSLILLGFIGLAVPWIKKVERKWWINLPLAAIAFGALVFSLPIDLPHPDPIKYNTEILHLSELTVILSLTGVGLSINRKFSFKGYRVPLLLTSVTMIGCIAAVAFASSLIGISLASAVLLGAVLAPTDPVLAGDVQVSLEESTAEEHPVKFSLTAEAGLNDSMAFPFVWLAILLATQGLNNSLPVLWSGYYLLYKIGVGIITGLLFGNLMAWLFISLPRKIDAEPRRLGMLAVSMTILVYGITELLLGYGFMSVFVSALTFRHFEKRHNYHRSLHNMVEELEVFFITLGLVMLGGYSIEHWREMIQWNVILIALSFLFIIRPLFGIIASARSGMSWRDRWLVSFLGIKGIGSFFYLAFALKMSSFTNSDLLWHITATTVIISVVVHRFVALHFVGKSTVE